MDALSLFLEFVRNHFWDSSRCFLYQIRFLHGCRFEMGGLFGPMGAVRAIGRGGKLSGISSA